MDCVLNQTETQQSAIKKTCIFSYRINNIYDAVKTLAAILSWMTNLAAWNPDMVPPQANQPNIVFFQVSTTGHNWIAKFKSKKHIELAIIIKVQRIFSKFALAAGDPDVGAWNFEDGSMIHKQDPDLQSAFHLMEFFLEDLNKVIVQQELLSFIEVPQLFTDLFTSLGTNNRGTEKT